MRRQVPATGGDDGEPKPQPGPESGATRPPLHQGATIIIISGVEQQLEAKRRKTPSDF